MSIATYQAPGNHRVWIFLRHLVEMTLAMMVGMFVFAVLVGVVAAAFGGNLDSVRLGQPEVFALGMAASMSVTMVAWMRRRGHGWRASSEMTAAMFVPAFALIGCYWFGVVHASSICPLACGLMIPAMVVAMLYRLDVYTAAHARAS